MCLTHYVPVLPSYRNQSIDLPSKSIDQFPYEGNTDTLWVTKNAYAHTNSWMKLRVFIQSFQAIRQKGES